ncbi:hypothetical protein BgiBS90_010536 [Biomphalaria glabrata]|nr:hypothetical protein BgiBS90_010536 [Biomphalaria glabrata]
MELMGITREATYLWTHENKGPCGSTLPSHQKQSANTRLPWRQCRYVPATTTVSTCPITSEPVLPLSAAALPNRDVPGVAPTSCYSQRQLGNNIFFPYRKQIVASKILTLPEPPDDAAHMLSQHAGLYVGHHPASQDVSVLSTSKAVPSLRRDPELPMTPNVGRSAQLEEFVRAYGASNGCYPPPPSNAAHKTLDPGQQQQVEHAKQAYSGSAYNSPTSHFSSDMRFMKNAMRAHRRDKQLQMNRGVPIDGDRVVNEGDTDWHRVMMLNGPSRPCPDDPERDRSQSLRIPDGMGGVCYIYPNKPASDTQEGKPSCVAGKMAPSGQKVIDSALEDTIKQMKTISSARDVLYERLIISDAAIHELKQKIYSLPSCDRSIDSPDLLKINDLQKYHDHLLNEIRRHDRELNKLWKHQFELETTLTNQLLDEVKSASIVPSN